MGAMSAGGHKTSAIPRPADASKAGTRPTERRDDTLFADFTSPIPQEKRLVRGRGKRTVITLFAAVIFAALAAALFVLPVKAWLRQQDDIQRKQSEVAALDQANGQLSDEVNRLNTPEGIEEAAREEIGYVQRGEIRITVVGTPNAPVQLPGGWPYDEVAQIIAVRRQQPAAPTAP
jgi:cell division protein FtsB